MSPRESILVIDDDHAVNETLTEILSGDFEVFSALSGAAGIQMARERKPRLILLDLNMPEMNGFSVCNQLRTQQDTLPIPILVLSGCDDRESRTKAFQMGADDFLGKPFDREELLARIQSKLRREGERSSHEQELHAGNLSLHQGRLEVQISGTIVPMSTLEFRLLWHLVKNVNRVLTREEILTDVWGGTQVIDRTIDTHIAGMRKKLSQSQFQITTVYGAGYVLRESKNPRD
jgi:two-component system alkaline phosphatase synthesis response regulator PhoP